MTELAAFVSRVEAIVVEVLGPAAARVEVLPGMNRFDVLVVLAPAAGGVVEETRLELRVRDALENYWPAEVFEVLVREPGTEGDGRESAFRLGAPRDEQ